MNYGSGYYGKSSSSSPSFLSLVAMFILILILTAGMKSCSRSESHMIYLSDGYTYHEDTKIIYIESESGRYGTKTSYAVYYDENGKVNKYDELTGEWIPVE